MARKQEKNFELLNVSEKLLIFLKNYPIKSERKKAVQGKFPAEKKTLYLFAREILCLTTLPNLRLKKRFREYSLQKRMFFFVVF